MRFVRNIEMPAYFVKQFQLSAVSIFFHRCYWVLFSAQFAVRVIY